MSIKNSFFVYTVVRPAWLRARCSYRLRRDHTANCYLPKRAYRASTRWLRGAPPLRSSCLSAASHLHATLYSTYYA